MPDLDQLTDEQIVKHVLTGDTDAYGELMTRYESKLLRYVAYLMRNPTAARDVVQETFIKAYQNLRSFKGAYRFSPWIYRIAHNEAMNHIKKHSHLSETDIDTLPETVYDEDVGDNIDREFLRRDVQHCIQQLDVKYRDVIQLAYFEHMKYDDISDVLHVPPSTVGVRLKRAKDQLRVLCERKGVKR